VLEAKETQKMVRLECCCAPRGSQHLIAGAGAGQSELHASLRACVAVSCELPSVRVGMRLARDVQMRMDMCVVFRCGGSGAWGTALVLRSEGCSRELCEAKIARGRSVSR
jgi:hypothetical protein